MKLFGKKKQPEVNKQPEERGTVFDYLLYNNVSGYTTDCSMLLSTVYRCVEVISDAVAQLPLEPYFIDTNGYKIKHKQHPTYNLLNREPNPNMSRFTFMKTLVTSTILQGNGYAFIDRNPKGDATGLYLIPSELVTVIPPRTIRDSIRYSVAGFGNVESCNMIHILNFSYDGINGISTVSHARNTLGLSVDSEAHAAGFFKGGANLAGILKVDSTLTSNQKKALKNSWQTAFSP